jgi:hypothetical protein
MNFDRKRRCYNYNIVDKPNENELDDYDINEVTVVFNLDYSFPLKLNNMKLFVEVLADFTSDFFYLLYSVITERVSIINIRNSSRDYLNIKKILKNIFNILKNELFITKRFDVEINKVDSKNEYRYNMMLRRKEIDENEYDYITDVEVDNNAVPIFKASIILKDDEDLTNFKRNMQILKLIFKYFENIELAVINSVIDVVMKEIELNIY